MRILVCWSEISGYLAACCRALAARQGVTLKLVAFAPNPTGNAPFNAEILRGIDHELLDAKQRHDQAYIASRVAAFGPDAAIIPGWFHRPYAALPRNPRLAGVRFALTMDTSWTGSLRQRLGWIAIRGLVRRLHRVLVIGERAWQLARVLRVPIGIIRRGCCGYDEEAFGPVFTGRAAAPHPCAFLYTGTFNYGKGLDVLLEAYARYRRQVADPWPLSCCGTGELNAAVSAAPGVVNHGFVQPGELPAVFGRHGAFVLPSRFEAWGVVIAEALASGMPVLCSEECGGTVELVRPYFNGLTFPAGDVDALLRALVWTHNNHEQLAEMGRRGRQFALAFSAAQWAQRVEWMFAD